MRPGVRKPLRVLVVAPRVPWPLSHGGNLRLYHLLRGLSARAQVTLAVPAPTEHAEQMPGDVRVEIMPPRDTCEPRTRNWVLARARRYFGCEAGAFEWLSANAHEDRFDVALLFAVPTGRYIDAVRLPVVWDAVDEAVLHELRNARWRGPRGWPAALRVALLCAAFERCVARRAAATVFASSVDASYARRWVGDARIAAISNGVDFDYFHPARQNPEPNTVAFIGSLDFPPNVEAVTRFATRVWPVVYADRPGRHLLLVGRTPTAAVRAAARQPGITLHGDVPDVRPYLERAAVIVVPTRLGGGVKNKILEACAMGRPVIASPRALAGLDVVRGREVVSADGHRAWIRKLIRLLEWPTRARIIGERGQRWVRANHGWPHMVDQLHDLLDRAAAGDRGAPGVLHADRVVTSAPRWGVREIREVVCH